MAWSKEKKAAWNKAYNAENKERLTQQKMTWAKRNPDKVKAAKKKYYEKIAAKAREERKRYQAEYRKKYPEKINANNSKRRAFEKEQLAKLNKAEQVEIEFMYLYNHIMPGDWHVDHIVALANGGLHHPSNLQILSAFDNISKGARLELGTL
jgi:5-methylcytosine-specific restriction endonuclease McrA